MPGNAINPGGATASDANILILLSLSEHSGHFRTCYWLAPVANDLTGLMAVGHSRYRWPDNVEGLPTGRQLVQASQDKGLPPIGAIDVIEP